MRRTARYLLSSQRQNQYLNQPRSGLFNYLYIQYLDVTSQLQTADPRAIASIVAGAVYLAVTDSATVYLFLTCFLIAVAIKVSVSYVPGLVIRIKPMHVLALALTLTTVVTWTPPASAQFFEALEQGVTDVVSDADTGIDETIIENIFTFFRIVIVLAFLVGVSVVLTQAFRGNDWGPIANMLGVGVAFVIVIELITSLILGDEGAGG